MANGGFQPQSELQTPKVATLKLKVPPRLSITAETMGQTIKGGQGDGGKWESVVMEPPSSPPALVLPWQQPCG